MLSQHVQSVMMPSFTMLACSWNWTKNGMVWLWIGKLDSRSHRPIQSEKHCQNNAPDHGEQGEHLPGFGCREASRRRIMKGRGKQVGKKKTNDLEPVNCAFSLVCARLGHAHHCRCSFCGRCVCRPDTLSCWSRKLPEGLILDSSSIEKASSTTQIALFWPCFPLFAEYWYPPRLYLGHVCQTWSNFLPSCTWFPLEQGCFSNGGYHQSGQCRVYPGNQFRKLCKGSGRCWNG